MFPSLPNEFFSIPELQATSGFQQRAHIAAWLRDSNVPHVVGRHGWPVVYRTKLLPERAEASENADTNQFDFKAARAPSRKTAKTL